MTRTILVTGATGLLGSRLVARLQRDGHQLVVTSRDRQKAAAHFGPTVRCVEWDYETEAFPEAALEGVSAVYHLMGENIGSGRWTPRKKRALQGSRIESTQKLVATLPASVSDFLCASAIGIYPGDSHEVLDENSPLPPPDSFMTRLCSDWERVAACAQSPDRRHVSMRIGLVLGEGGMLAALVPLYRLGLGGPVGSGDQYLPWVHIDDVVEMFVFVLEHPALSGAVNLVGPSPTTLERFSRELARQLHRPHFLRVPEIAIRLALGEASALVLSSYNVLPTRLLENGYTFRHARLEDALEDVLRESY